MTNNNKPLTPISNRQYFQALMKTLKRNVNILILDTYITPECLTICFAINRRNENTWEPRIFDYYIKTRKVHIQYNLLDFNPVIVDAATFLYMDEVKSTV